MKIDIEEANVLIAEEIGKHRSKINISQRELARRTNLSHSKISMLEGSKGFKKNHGIFTLVTVFKELKMNLSDLIKKIEKM